jgi:hypothetical protein
MHGFNNCSAHCTGNLIWQKYNTHVIPPFTIFLIKNFGIKLVTICRHNELYISWFNPHSKPFILLRTILIFVNIRIIWSTTDRCWSSSLSPLIVLIIYWFWLSTYSYCKCTTSSVQSRTKTRRLLKPITMFRRNCSNYFTLINFWMKGLHLDNIELFRKCFSRYYHTIVLKDQWW